MEPRAIATTYYHRSETSYAFGPFTEKQLNRFIQCDPTPDKHGPWEVVWFNKPWTYGTGNECSSWSTD